MDTLIRSLEKLIEQSSEALGPDAPSTLMLKQQLAAALASRQPSKKVFWMQARGAEPGPDEKKD